MVQTYMRLGELLVSRGVLTNLQLHIALADQRISNRRLGEILVERGFAAEYDVAQALADQYGYEVESLDGYQPQSEFLQRISAEDAYSLRALPIGVEDDRLLVAVSDPIDVYSTDRLAHLAGCRVQLRIAAESKLLKTICIAYGLTEVVSPKFEAATKAPDRFRGFTVRHRFPHGTVLQAFDSHLDRLVTLLAVKTDQPLEADHFQIVRMAAKTPLPGLLPIFDSLTHGGYRWTVMANWEGESLEGVVRLRGPRSVPQATELAAKVAETADALLRHGSRADWICPHNIILTREGPVVSPFSLVPSQYLTPNPGYDQEDPEGAAAYAIGVLLKDCLKSASKETAVPMQLEEILTKCLADDPSKRYRSPIEIAGDLRSYNWNAITSPLAQSTNREREELLGLLELHDSGRTETPSQTKEPFWAKWFKRRAA